MLGECGLSRLVCSTALDGGALVNLVEFPAVSRNTSRLRVQVMAEHTQDDLDEFVGILSQARTAARSDRPLIGHAL